MTDFAPILIEIYYFPTAAEKDPSKFHSDQDFWKDFPLFTEAYDDLDPEHELDPDSLFHHPAAESTLPPVTTPAEPRPLFLDGDEANVTAQLGGRASMSCRVEQLGDKTVTNTLFLTT